MTMRCDEIDGLLAPFALDALEPDERLEVLEHLSECRSHDEELASYRLVAARLPVVIDEVAPPPGLRASILRAFDAAQSQPLAEAAPPPRESFLARLFGRTGLAYGVAAVLIAAVLGLAAWNLSLQGDDSGSVVARTVEQDSMRLHFVYLPDEKVVVLNLDMPPPAAGRDYQLWQITDAGPRSLGIVEYQGSQAIQADLGGASALAVSVEPAGGSAQPTTTPVIVAEL
jgi:anti-sigma-K factor RskA